MAYPLDDQGNQKYSFRTNSRVIFNRGETNRQIYAKTALKDEFYPDTGQIAEDENGQHYYAVDRHGTIIFPKDKRGNEFYLKLRDGRLVFGQGLRYAKRVSGMEIYPTSKTDEAAEYEYPLMEPLRYAKNAENEPYYPLDYFGHEMWFGTIESQPKEYPITNDGYYMVPSVNNQPHFQQDLTPKLNTSHIIGIVDLPLNYKKSFVTNVRSSRPSRSIHPVKYTVYPLDTTPSNSNTSSKVDPKTVAISDDTNNELPVEKDEDDELMEEEDDSLLEEEDDSLLEEEDDEDDEFMEEEEEEEKKKSSTPRSYFQYLLNQPSIIFLISTILFAMVGFVIWYFKQQRLRSN